MKSMTILGMTTHVEGETKIGDELLPGLASPCHIPAKTEYHWKVSVVGFGRNWDSPLAETKVFILSTPDVADARKIIERESAQDLAAYRVGD